MIEIKTLKNQKHDTGSAQGSLHSAKLHENTPEAHVTMRGGIKPCRVNVKMGPRFEARERFETGKRLVYEHNSKNEKFFLISHSANSQK